MIDLERITHPLRLASGTHEPGSGKGCAMNVISYINGDTKITDYPECSARPLARLVQTLNDRLAGKDGFLSPEDSVTVLDLGWLTVGTASVPKAVVWQWLADLLIDPKMGVVKHATGHDAVAIRTVAARAAAYAYAYAAADAAAAAAAAAAAYAAAAADAAAAAYAAAYAATYAAADAAAATAADAAARINFTRWAITRWRELAGLDQGDDIDTDSVNFALERIGA